LESVYVFSSGTLRRSQNTIVLETDDGKKYVPVENVAEIKIFGEVNLNKRLLEFLTKKGIIVHFFNHEGYYVGTYYPRESNQVGITVLKQAEHYLDQKKRIEIASKIVEGASYNISSLLRSYKAKGYDLSGYIDSIADLKARIENAQTIEELMAIEGNIRQMYYSSLDVLVKDENFRVGKRERRPPTNYMNTLISFGNSLLYTTALSEIFKTHMDPRIGYLHETNLRRFSLNLDIAEIFKPVVVDRVILRLVNRSEISPSHFSKIAMGLKLNEKGKRLFAKAFEERLKETIFHARLKRKVSFRTLIRLEVYKLEKHILGMETYRPYHHDY